MRHHFYSPQTKLRKGNVLHLSVSHSAHSGGGAGGVCLSACKDSPPKQTPPGRHPPADTPLADPPPSGWPLQRTVRILLECILVSLQVYFPAWNPFLPGIQPSYIRVFRKCTKLTILEVTPTLCSHFFHMNTDASKYKRIILQG